MNAPASPPPFRVRGGLRNRRGAASWPFAVLTADTDRIVLKGPLGGVWYDRSQLITISRRMALTGDGLRFAPEDLHVETVTFYTLPGRGDELVRRLRLLGWDVHADPHI